VRRARPIHRNPRDGRADAAVPITGCRHSPCSSRTTISTSSSWGPRLPAVSSLTTHRRSGSIPPTPTRSRLAATRLRQPRIAIAIPRSAPARVNKCVAFAAYSGPIAASDRSTLGPKRPGGTGTDRFLVGRRSPAAAFFRRLRATGAPSCRAGTCESRSSGRMIREHSSWCCSRICSTGSRFIHSRANS
jgi:hypothetical protein